MTTMVEPVMSAGRREDIEAELDALGLTWRFNADGDIADIDIKKSLANQARLGEPINQERVATYLEALRTNAKFPAVVCDFTGRKRKGILMDGNHRIIAAEQGGYNIFARYEVTAGDPTAIVLYTFRANVRHGLPNSMEDRVEHAIWLVESGVGQTQALRQLQVPKSQFNKAWGRHLADRKADEVGLDRSIWDTLGSSIKARLQSVKADESFFAAAMLTYKAGLGMDEVQELVAELNSTNSVNKQEQIIRSRESAYEDRIRERAGGTLSRGKSKKAMTPKQRYSMALGTIMGLPEPAAVVRQISGAEREEFKKRCRESGNKLLDLAKAL